MKQSSAHIADIEQKLGAYKRKYFLNMLLKGFLVSVGILSVTFLVLNTAEFWGRFPVVVRTAMFLSFVGCSLFLLLRYIAWPLYLVVSYNKHMGNEIAAKNIGLFFPEIKDKLLNLIQLHSLSTNELAQQSIAQKASQFSHYQFDSAIDLNQNIKKYNWIFLPLLLLISIYFFWPSYYAESTQRLIKFNQEFTPPPPFTFEIKHPVIKGFKNEPVILRVGIRGNTIPEHVYVDLGGITHKMEGLGDGQFQYKIENALEDETFRYQAAGFYSDFVKLELVHKPTLGQFEVKVIPPAYTGLPSQTLQNSGNITVPEGSMLQWNIKTEHVSKASVLFQNENWPMEAKMFTSDQFEFKKKILLSGIYTLSLFNDEVSTPSEVPYDVALTMDQAPTISLQSVEDSISYSYALLSGSIKDDYGFSQLNVRYRKNSAKNTPSKYFTQKIKFSPKSNAQNYFHALKWDSLPLAPNEYIEYYVEVWDNDGVHGPKSAKSGVFIVQKPSEREMVAMIDKTSEEVEQELEQSLEKAKDLQKEIKKIDNKIKSKKQLNWQDKKQLEEILQKHDDLKQQLEKLQEKNEKLNQQQNPEDNKNQKIAEKTKMLEDLMKNILDEETKKLYEELQKLMAEKSTDQQIQQQIEQIKKKDVDIEKELDRALEMFKQLQFEQKLDKSIENLEKLAKEQEQLSKETEKADEKELSNIQEKQKELNEKLAEEKKALKDLEELNKSMENPQDMDKESQENVDQAGEEQKNSSEALEKNKSKEASKSQKKAADKMKEAAQKLAQGKQKQESQQAQENIKDLKQILDNLITISFHQEDLMRELKSINQQDPNYLKLTQKQLQLKDDSKIIEDSLKALAKRVFQIKSFVTREVTSMQNYIDESIKAVRQRRPDIAAGKGQFAMTSMNNLALMLNQVLSQMQDEHMDGKANGGAMCKKPGKKGKPTSLGDLQKQLSQRIQQLQKSGMSGKALSKELAKMAAEQEMLRNSLKELEGGSEEKDGKNGQKAGSSQSLKELAKQMEENEKDLVNKKITQETILRQQEILTKLLEAEKAKRERETENKRESNTAKETERALPPSLQKYLQEKQKQVELLQTIPPSLTPYYKKEVNDYFQKLQH